MWRVGIDVGGTFTDLFAWGSDEGGRTTIREAKVLTTPADPSGGVMDVIRAAEIDLREVSTIMHGTTIGTNALIERRYPEPALITTPGFRDVLEIGRQRRRLLYDPYQVKPKPLILRSHRFTVPERLGADGETVEPLDRDATRRVAEQIGELGVQSIAIAFINAYRDGRHEEEAAAIVAEVLPDVQLAISSHTRPKMRELGRFTTTAVRAALLPVVGRYLERLEQELKDAGSTARLFIVKSNGGIMGVASARDRPEELIASGPAGGVAAGSYLSELVSRANLVVTDVGGTSFEASLLEGGVGLVADEYEIDWERPVTTPMLDIRSIGAGGGSIAWIDDGGSLRVGPQSAGAIPGPACYGNGGELPTVTDANLVLGRIDPELGGKFTLDAEAAERAIATVAGPMGLSVPDCAEGITRIVSENMASAIRMVSTDRGRDPRDHAILACGGAGGLHAYEIARSVGAAEVIVPRFSGVACAFGATTMDIRHDLEATFYADTAEIDLDALNAAFEELERQAAELLEVDGVGPDAQQLERSAQMRYVGQSYEVSTPVPTGRLDAEGVARIAEHFHTVHRREYGVADERFSVAFVTLRVTGIGLAARPDGGELAAALQDGRGGTHDRPSVTRRQVYFDGAFHEAEVYDGAQLEGGQVLVGPAIVEQRDGVVVLPPGAFGRADEFENVLITATKEQA
jgi:N-methylhydantoinase A